MSVCGPLTPAQLLADASVTVQEIVAHESERLLEALGAPPSHSFSPGMPRPQQDGLCPVEPFIPSELSESLALPEADPDCHLPSPLAETVADLTTRDVLDVLGAVEAVVAAQVSPLPPKLSAYMSIHLHGHC